MPDSLFNAYPRQLGLVLRALTLIRKFDPSMRGIPGPVRVAVSSHRTRVASMLSSVLFCLVLTAILSFHGACRVMCVLHHGIRT